MHTNVFFFSLVPQITRHSVYSTVEMQKFSEYPVCRLISFRVIESQKLVLSRIYRLETIDAK